MNYSNENSFAVIFIDAEGRVATYPNWEIIDFDENGNAVSVYDQVADAIAIAVNHFGVVPTQTFVRFFNA